MLLSSLRSAWANPLLRKTLLWQALLTVAAAFIAAYFTGTHGALSAVCGGAISMAAGVVFAAIAKVRPSADAGDVLLTAFKAEGAKIGFIVVALWVVLATYRSAVTVVLIGTFIVATLASSLAPFIGVKRVGNKRR